MVISKLRKKNSQAHVVREKKRRLAIPRAGTSMRSRAKKRPERVRLWFGLACLFA